MILKIKNKMCVYENTKEKECDACKLNWDEEPKDAKQDENEFEESKESKEEDDDD